MRLITELKGINWKKSLPRETKRDLKFWEKKIGEDTKMGTHERWWDQYSKLLFKLI
jgi:hypothetical protein